MLTQDLVMLSALRASVSWVFVGLWVVDIELGGDELVLDEEGVRDDVDVDESVEGGETNEKF